MDLPAEDTANAERFTESRRAARLNEALARDHMKFLREVVLADEDTARLWWLHRNLAGDDPATSWDVFNDVVRPLIRIADENDPVTKLARALLTMNDYIHEDPERLQTLANIAAFATAKVGQGELARTLPTLRQSAPSDANGSTPAKDATVATADTTITAAVDDPLAHALITVQDERLDQDLTLRPDTIVSTATELRGHLAAVRNGGVAVVKRFWPEPVISVATPILRSQSGPIAALSVAPTRTMPSRPSCGKRSSRSHARSRVRQS